MRGVSDNSAVESLEVPLLGMGRIVEEASGMGIESQCGPIGY